MSPTDHRPPAAETTFRDGPWHSADRDLGRLIEDLQRAREDVRLEAQALREHPGLFDAATVDSAQTERASAINGIAERLQHVASQLATGRDPARVRLAELTQQAQIQPTPAGLALPADTRRVVATFHPQCWQNGYAVTVDPCGPVKFDVTEEVLALGREHALTLEDDSHASDDLRSARLAPAWIKDWQGPFYVEVQQAIEDFYEATAHQLGMAAYTPPAAHEMSR